VRKNTHAPEGVSLKRAVALVSYKMG